MRTDLIGQARLPRYSVDAQDVAGTDPDDQEVIDTNTGTRTLENHLTWLQAFVAQRGRPLRVLHVGNIANNAYLNAKFMRSVGVEAHVLCYDYQHVMAMPEWEDVELHHGHGNDYRPTISWRDLRGYRRPSWFVSGPLPACTAQIATLRGEGPSWWRRALLFLLKQLINTTERLFGARAGYGIQLLIQQPRVFVYRFWRYLRSRFGNENIVLNFLAATRRRLKFVSNDGLDNVGDAVLQQRLLPMIEQFNRAFPSRHDRLKSADVFPYTATVNYFTDIFQYYDIVQCYATDPIHALLSDKRPYVAFEHGTLRDFTTDDDPLHRLTSLAYREADHTFITNGDCLAYAERLGIENYSPIIHPIDVEQHRQDFGDAIGALRREIDGDIILFCPVRHDWKIKGTDVHLRALPLIKARVPGQVKLVLIHWGMQLAESEALLESLGCSGDVVWKPSMCRITMIKHVRAADVVLDQMALPHFGATAPQAIAAGTPVISSYVPESTRWIIPEPAPILPAFSPEEVAEAVVQALDPGWRADYKRSARQWTDRYHHPNNVIRDHLKIYQRVLEKHDRQGN